MSRSDATLSQVEKFLSEFKMKSRIFGIVYNMDKNENRQTMIDLELFGDKRDKVIYNLNARDYYQGPESNINNPNEGNVWMFGVGVYERNKRKKIPIYIKIYITVLQGEPNYCISFHRAKFKMIFPYKTEL